MKNWMEYWQERGNTGEKDVLLVSGYDKGPSKLTKGAVKQVLGFISKSLELGKKDKILEVGCGAGLWLIPLSKKYPRIVGIDQSASMLKRIPNGLETHRCFADKLPFADNSFDKILCFSIFQYFPDKKYAKKVVKEMLRVCKKGRKTLICDLPDVEKKKAYNKKKKIEKHGLQRLFYDRKMFRQISPSAKIIDKEYKGYGNSKYRFNVLIVKK